MAELSHQETFRQGIAGYHNDFKLIGRPWGFNLELIDANPIRWYHGAIDINTSSDAARATASVANRHRPNMDFREIPGLDHLTLQRERMFECMDWLRK